MAAGTRAAGTLSWEELSVRMVGRETSAGLQIDVTILDPPALTVAAPDIRAYLEDLQRRARVESGLSEREFSERKTFLVGFTGFEKEVHYDPTLLHIRSEGSTFHPLRIIPVSERFERRVVDLYQTVYAIYLPREGETTLPRDLAVTNFTPAAGATMTLVGSSAAIKWERAGTGFVAHTSGGAPPNADAWVFQIKDK